jgi:KUP system potassium uptake protein
MGDKRLALKTGLDCMTKITSEAQPFSTALGGEHQQHLRALTFGCIGVVYGDIGTSPLYAFREAVNAAQDTGSLTQTTVLEVLSLILWSLIVVVTLKYVLILLRADNNGEGGTLSLTALAFGRRTTLVLLLGTIGASMFLGDPSSLRQFQ